MKLEVDYREEPAGTLTGVKDHLLICRANFSKEERAIIQERGLYNQSITIPADKGLPTKEVAIGIRALKLIGLVLAPLGLLFSCAQFANPKLSEGAGATPALMLVIGIGLFSFGWYREREALKIEESPTQTLSVSRLLSNPDFMVHAYTPEEARQYQEQVRAEFADLAQMIRDSSPAPEKNTYEL